MPHSSKYGPTFTLIVDSLVLIFHVSLLSDLMVHPWLCARTIQEDSLKMP